MLDNPGTAHTELRFGEAFDRTARCTLQPRTDVEWNSKTQQNSKRVISVLVLIQGLSD